MKGMDKMRYFAFGKERSASLASTSEGLARKDFREEYGFEAETVEYETSSGEMIEIWRAPKKIG